MRNKIIIITAVVIGSFFLAFAQNSQTAYTVEVKDGWFYVNGEKFFIKGVTYSGWRPGESPSDLDRVNLELAEHDFKLIKEAGFNTIRTAGGLTPELISLARKHGLMVMHGIWFDGNIDYRDPRQIDYACGMLKSDLAWSKDFDNIICFLVMNEPVMERVRDAGKSGIENFLKATRNTVKAIVPDKPVSFANWVPLTFIDHSFWDAVCFNVYIYGSATITHSLGFLGYIEHLKEKLAREKPLIITEFGLSVSKQRVGELAPNNYGYGGNTLEQQKEGIMKMYDELIQAQATGGCVHGWVDEWWMTGDKSRHDDLPEEYFGIVELDRNNKGTPRPVYYALKEYNQAIVIEPKKLSFYSNELPVEVYSTEQVGLIRYRLDNGKWQDLIKTGNFWWKAKLEISKLADGKHNLEIKALDKNNNTLCIKRQDVWVVNKSKPDTIPYRVEIHTDKDEYRIREKLKLTVTVTDAKGNPVSNQTVYYSFFQPIDWDERKSQKITDKEGRITTQFSTFTPGFLTITAGVVYKNQDYERTFGDTKAVLFK